MVATIMVVVVEAKKTRCSNSGDDNVDGGRMVKTIMVMSMWW